MKWILIGVDGTGSSKWAKESGDNSHVETFYHKFGGSLSSNDLVKKYLDGPNSEITGLDATSIEGSIYSFIVQSMELMYSSSTITKEEMIALGKTYRTVKSTVPDSTNKMIGSHDYLRIVLIGHSRGGAIVIDIANKLSRYNIPIYFMGLFDAVDRSIFIDGGPIKNTRYAYHALRGLEDSRSSFNNTGTDFLDEKASKILKEGVDQSGTNYKYFKTSHGGIGGDIEHFPTSSTSDFSCAASGSAFLPVPVSMKPFLNYESAKTRIPKTRREIVDRCMQESENAYKWMVTNARKCNIPI